MKFYSLLTVVAFLLISCGKDPKDSTLLITELNTSGTRHTVTYSGALPSSIRFETFHGSGTRDTTHADSVIRREIDSISYDHEANTILLTRLTDGPAGSSYERFRKYYFNSDNLLTRITRFGGNSEYLTDSVAYDYTTQTVHYFDMVNKRLYELVYDSKMNIESVSEKRMNDQRVYRTIYFYYDASRNPFLANLDEDEELFGCFHFDTPGLFWNNASRPVFSSRNNVQSFKEVTGNDETNGLYEYQYRQGLPAIQFGNESVIYYHYRKVTE